MKYFAKYLPVEGEIKEGDKVKHNGQIVTALKQEGEGDTWKTDGLPTYGSNLEKVKLFLCSREIQVGDKTRHKNGAESVLVPLSEEDAKYRARNGFFKVIGEISPEALAYVKEGDEFKEDEWEGYTDLGLRLGSPINKGGYKGSKPLLITIKGPCGHFH